MGSGANLLPLILADVGSRFGPEISAGLGSIFPPAFEAGKAPDAAFLQSTIPDPLSEIEPFDVRKQHFPTEDIPQEFPRAGKLIGAGLGAGVGLLGASLLGQTQDQQPRRVADSSGFRPTKFGPIAFPGFPTTTIQSGDASSIAGSNREAALLRILRQRRRLV